ncbi:MAG: D-glycero-beta-D-manno-heptose 1-phosphate adenylyltransferase [Candidatus Omnitrophota bacterium]|nr:MAG: D-glycero-beta-D-manno-heptose 1-phosphate adenylyltransferase [Candidatus Omnitrophota bacterium]
MMRTLEDKIKSVSELKSILRKIKSCGQTIVFTNGCFDIIHYGHVKYLQEAKKLGDILVVGINTDSSVKKIKGPDRPVNNQKDRVGVISGLESVDFVVTFSEKTPANLIKALKPDFLVKGADWSTKNIVGADFIKSYGGRVRTIKLLPGRSTSQIINKIAKSCR